MKYIIATALLLFAITANAQLVRGAGVGYTNGVPSHNPGALGSPQAIDTITGYWYQYEYSTGVWRQAGFWLQPTGEAGAPSYTPIKQRQLFAINAGDSIYYYRSGQWRHLNPPPSAGTNIAVSGQTVSLDTLGLVLFKTDQTYSNGVGTLGWDNDYKTLAIGVTTDLDLRVGQNEMYHVLNDTTATLAKGKLVMATGTTGNSGKIKANYFLADGNTHGRYVLGVVAENIANGAEGYVMAFGLVRGINASGTPYGESWVNGDILYAHPDSLGGLTKVRPTSPDEEVVVAIVVSNSSTVGSIFVRPQFPFDLGELGDVKIANPTNGQVLSYNNGIWENANAGSGVQYSDTTSLIATQYFVTSQGYLTSEVDGSTTNEIQTIDTFSISGKTISLSLLNDGEDAKTITLPTDTMTMIIACSDETTNLAADSTVAVVTFTAPYAITVTKVKADVNTAPTGSGITVDVNEAGTSIFSTKLTIDADEKTSETAATAAVISDSSIANNAEVTINIDAVGSTTAGKGLKVTIYYLKQ